MPLDSALTATAGSRLPTATAAGFADKLYRLDGGSLPRERRDGLDPRRKRRAEHPVLVDLLADTAGEPMVTLGYGCSRIGFERPQRMVNPA